MIARRATNQAGRGGRRRARAAAFVTAATLGVGLSLGVAGSATASDAAQLSGGTEPVTDRTPNPNTPTQPGRPSTTPGIPNPTATANPTGTAAPTAPSNLPAVSGAQAGAVGAPGDNGDVKIHEVGTPVPDRLNQPHVCAFYLDAFGFDAGEQVSWTIYQMPPTGDKETLAKAGTIVLGADGTGHTTQISLPDGHYKLYWNFVGEKGSAKHKVFWVACEEQPTSPPPSCPPDDEKCGEPSCPPDDKKCTESTKTPTCPTDDKTCGESTPPCVENCTPPPTDVSAERTGALASTGAKVMLAFIVGLALLGAGVAFLKFGDRLPGVGRKH